MVLALVNEAGAEPRATPGARTQGRALAATMDALWQALARSGRDGDMGRVFSLLQAASYADFGRAGAEPSAALPQQPPGPVEPLEPGATGAHAAPGHDRLTYTDRDAVAAGRFLRVVNYHNTPRSGRHAAGGARRLRPAVPACRARGVDQFFETAGRLGPARLSCRLPTQGCPDSAEVAAHRARRARASGWFSWCDRVVDCPVEEQEAFARAHWIELVREDLEHPRRAAGDDLGRRGAALQRHVVEPAHGLTRRHRGRRHRRGPRAGGVRAQAHDGRRHRRLPHRPSPGCTAPSGA